MSLKGVNDETGRLQIHAIQDILESLIVQLDAASTSFNGNTVLHVDMLALQMLVKSSKRDFNRTLTMNHLI